MPIKFKNKKLMLGAIILILILFGIFTFFGEKSRISNYPTKVSFREKILASISYPFQRGGQKIEVDIAQQKMKIFENGKVVREFSVSTGKEKTPTPAGSFKVYKKNIMVYSRLSNCWLPFWVGFSTDGLYGFHEFPICPEGRKGLEELGKPASAGCVRLGIQDSEIFYKWVKIGTPIKIY